jgi:uncharacterized cupredoxin-like copper-binding protein
VARSGAAGRHVPRSRKLSMHARSLFLIALAAAVAGACNGDRVQDTAEVDPQPPTEAFDTAGEHAGAAPAPGDTIAATLDEYFIDIPIEVPAGRTVFRVHNNGAERHSFAVEVEGRRLAELPEPLEPGEEGVIEADLPADAEVVVLCPITGHEPEGMRMQLRVRNGEIR